MNARRSIYYLTYLAAALSAGHHIDHVIRGNAVGWPLTAEVNAFTISLGIYPVLLTALLLYRAGKVGPGFWMFLSSGGAIFVSLVHFGPFAVEPPHLVHGGHESSIAGWFTFSWLVAFVGILIITSVVEARAWYAERQAGKEQVRGAVHGVAR